MERVLICVEHSSRLGNTGTRQPGHVLRQINPLILGSALPNPAISDPPLIFNPPNPLNPFPSVMTCIRSALLAPPVRSDSSAASGKTQHYTRYLMLGNNVTE